MMKILNVMSSKIIWFDLFMPYIYFVFSKWKINNRKYRLYFLTKIIAPVSYKVRKPQQKVSNLNFCSFFQKFYGYFFLYPKTFLSQIIEPTGISWTTICCCFFYKKMRRFFSKCQWPLQRQQQQNRTINFIYIKKYMSLMVLYSLQ